MTEPRFLPAEVGPNQDGSALRIAWKDGHLSEYPPLQLRLACPCAGCVDEMTGRKILQPESVDPSVHPLEINYVGRYALSFRWNDGHDTGIFPFQYLRKLCPCPACA